MKTQSAPSPRSLNWIVIPLWGGVVASIWQNCIGRARADGMIHHHQQASFGWTFVAVAVIVGLALAASRRRS